MLPRCNVEFDKEGFSRYFTPRPLIRAIIECVRPKLGETIYDPACGTCGFLLAAHGIKTNVLFFDRVPLKGEAATKKLWVYDLRTNMHFTLRSKRLEESDLYEFVNCYKPEDRQIREATWSPHNSNGRWRAYSYEELSQRDKCNLDIFWLKDEEQYDISNDIAPGELATEIMEDLQAVMIQISEIASDLSDVG